MKIHHASKKIEDLLNETEKKSEKKIYQKLLGVLSSLSARGLSVEQLRSIEEAIDRLLLPEGVETNIKQLRKSHNQFMKFLRETLSLIPGGHYMTLGIAFGAAFGTLLGSVFQGLTGIPHGTSGTGVGVGIGIMAGLIIGRYMDLEAEKQNRVLLV